MIFNSLTYLVFLTIVVILYWSSSYRGRLLIIFTASIIFYGFWRVEFIPLLMFSVFVDWFISLRMQCASNKRRFILLILSLSSNIGLLFYFKYTIFFAENFVSFANLLGADLDPFLLNIILPLGISFYTFQTISYTVDVYRNRIIPEKNFLLFACYVTFFPQLIAGPILRAHEVMHQFTREKHFNLSDLLIGARRILYGLFLKVVLADNIAPFVDQGYAIPVDAVSALDVWTLAFLFGFQIYFDFSGYSHIAIGSARLLGITFPENFEFPYLATSPREFWRRWHISLSNWIRDYLYLPLTKTEYLAASEKGLSVAMKKADNLFPLYFTWFLMGLWHGANWTFALWGIYHAAVITVYRIVNPLGYRLNATLRSIAGMFFTLPIIMLGWIPFRSETLPHALEMWMKIFNYHAYFWLGMRENTYIITFILLVGFLGSAFTRNIFFAAPEMLNRFLQIIDIFLLGILFMLVVIFLRPIDQFIYFQF